MTTRADKWEIYMDAKSRFRWRCIAPNGRTLAQSVRGYASKSSCILSAQRFGGTAITFCDAKDVRWPWEARIACSKWLSVLACSLTRNEWVGVSAIVALMAIAVDFFLAFVVR